MKRVKEFFFVEKWLLSKLLRYVKNPFFFSPQSALSLTGFPKGTCLYNQQLAVRAPPGSSFPLRDAAPVDAQQPPLNPCMGLPPLGAGGG